tara:strand:- start:9092 stop:10069 length:978 start_codon:yes stop_codon:yes gene_type:complete
MKICSYCKQPISSLGDQTLCPEISIILPIYNEINILQELYNQLTSALKKITESYELIFVDDGSRDGSYKFLEELNRKDSDHVRVLKLSRNFGHHIALTSGIQHSKGKYTVIMDSDLQDRPEEIEKLYEKIKEGYDCVYGNREDSTHSRFKKITSFLFNKLMNLIVDAYVPINSSVFRIMNRNFVENFNKLGEQERFIPGMMSWMGFKQTGILLKHGHRFSGKTKYSIVKMIRLSFNSLTSYSFLPLQISSLFGFIIAFLAGVAIIILAFRKILLGYIIDGWTSLIITILFIGGIQLIALGIMGEYIGRTYLESQKKPLYFIEKHL